MRSHITQLVLTSALLALSACGSATPMVDNGYFCTVTGTVVDPATGKSFAIMFTSESTLVADGGSWNVTTTLSTDFSPNAPPVTSVTEHFDNVERPWFEGTIDLHRRYTFDWHVDALGWHTPNAYDWHVDGENLKVTDGPTCVRK